MVYSFSLQCFLHVAFTIGFLFIPLANSSDIGFCMTRASFKFVEYRKSEQICCNRKLRIKNGNQECCGDEIIDANIYLCCGGNKYNKNGTSGSDQSQNISCCGSQAIRTNESACCFDHVIMLTEEQRKKPEHIKCCSKSEIVDLRSEYCCGGRRFKRGGTSCCAGTQYFTNLRRCVLVSGVEKIIYKDEAICGTETYRRDQQSCCGGVLNTTVPEFDPRNISMKNEHFGCCGASVIDPTTQKCCSHYKGFPSHAIPKHEDFKCCGNGYYNTTCQECVANKIVPKPPGHIRCGQRLIDTQQEGCCAYNKPYNLTDQQCCNGGHSNVIKRSQICCNGAGLGDNQLCCQNFKPCTKSQSEDDECCFDFYTLKAETYNSKLKRCEGGLVVPKHQEIKMCGNRPFNPSKQFCCDGWTLTDIASGNDSCCGMVSYDSKKQTCCCGMVFNVSSNNAQCCDRDCRATLRGDPSSPCTASCPANKSVTFDPETQTCCVDKVHETKPDGSCCGSLYVDNKRKSCCANQIVYRMRRSIDCCNNTILFDKKTSSCSDDEVVTQRTGWSDTQAVCSRTMMKSVDGIKDHACRDLYALVGRPKGLKIFRKAVPNEIILELTLTRVRSLRLGLGLKQTTFPRKLTLRIHVPHGDGVVCKSGLMKRSGKVAVFFSAPVRGYIITITAEENFRLIQQRVLRKLSFNSGLCASSDD